jgi:hypothetical protein
VCACEGEREGWGRLGKKERKIERGNVNIHAYIHVCVHNMTFLPTASSRHNTIDRMTSERGRERVYIYILCVCVCVCVYVCTHIHVCMYHMYVRMYVYRYTHTNDNDNDDDDDNHSRSFVIILHRFVCASLSSS